jgi:ABC-type transporter Mla subunit MlaD
MSNDRLSRAGTSLRLLAAAALAALAVTAVLATTGSARTTPKTLHLVGTQQNSGGFMPSGAPVPGARLGQVDKITGGDSGTSDVVCTLIGKRGFALCNIEIQLKKGTITAQAMTNLTGAANPPVAITGGTGAYDGARGTATIHDVNQTKIDITISFT